jgi:hypothetical protein
MTRDEFERLSSLSFDVRTTINKLINMEPARLTALLDTVAIKLHEESGAEISQSNAESASA